MAVDTSTNVAQDIKPHLRGWLHVGGVPLAAALGMAALSMTQSGPERVAVAVFVATSLVLFATSALYHRGRWSPATTMRLKRLDHSNIFLIIAGTHTPFLVLLMDPGTAQTLLWVVWLAAMAGVLFKVAWLGAPRWMGPILYLALGWAAVVYVADLLSSGGWVVVALIATGGVFYTVGAVVYALKRPNPSPRWFGFHEVFHALVVVGYVLHGAAVIVVLQAT